MFITPVEQLRKKYDFFNEYNIALVAAFDTREIKDEEWLLRYLFYENIGRKMNSLGKSVFLPHKDMNWRKWEYKKIYEVACNIVIPNSDLILFYPEVKSTNTGLMLGSAYTWDIPAIVFYEKDIEFEEKERLFMPRVLDEIRFTNHNEVINRLESSIRRFYEN